MNSQTQLDFIAESFGQSGDTLAAWLADPRYTQAQVAYFLGTTPNHLARLLAQPGPPLPNPVNWTNRDTGPCPYAGRWQGIAPIPYAGPAEPGFTYGPPVYAADGHRPILSFND